ncbi:MAG: leucine-rich repeat protein [Lachnospiraceae bacterium]|nr:leucine-rich repeat protein [Lachnospiraceae bacterium]
MTDIGEDAFYNCSSLGTVTIPKSVKSIENSSFSGCSSLESVTISEGVTSIGGYAFSRCSSLKNLMIPKGVTNIEFFAFSGCSSLESVTILEGVTSIGYHVFKDCSSLEHIVLPKSWQKIDSYARFDGCSKLLTAGPIGGEYNIEFGWNESIPEYAFNECSNLESVTIPEGVTSIGETAFKNCSNLEHIVIPKSWQDMTYDNNIHTRFASSSKLLTAGPIGGGYNIEFGWDENIPAYAFYKCSCLKSVVIPEGVTDVGEFTFKNCSLEHVVLPKSWKGNIYERFGGFSKLLTAGPIGGGYDIEFGWDENIPAYAFNRCSRLKNVTIPEGVTSIGNSAFNGCSSLVTVTIPEGVTSIGESAFSGCSSLGTVTIPEGVTSIGGSAFSGCSSLATVTIPEGVTSIGDSTFSGCSSLVIVAIPKGVTSIGGFSFYRCSSLESVTIPEGVTSIGRAAFSGCSSLVTVTIPERVTSIGSEAFYNCSSLELVVLPNSWQEITDDDNDDEIYSRFVGCSKLLTAGPAGGGYNIEIGWDENIPAYAFYGCSSLESVTIPEGVTNIGSYAFEGCSSLENVTIPEGVTNIGSYAFDDCSNLESVTIPEGVTSIGAYAFRNCASLEKVIIPKTARTIGYSWGYNYSIFSGCEKLETAGPVGGGYNIEYAWDEIIPERAFLEADHLKSVVIRESISKIEAAAFSGCSSLGKVTIPESVTSIGDSAFSSCSSLRSITFPKGLTSIGSRAFYGCSSLSGIAVPVSIGDSVFSGCISLKSLTILEGVKTIGYSAFSGCSSLSTVTFPESVTNIGNSAFYGCSNLRKVTISEGVTSIGDSAFSGCNELKELQIPYSVKSIGENAFKNCGIEGELTIAASSVGEDAFYGCTGITKVTILAGLTSLKKELFCGCTALESIVLPYSIKTIEDYAFDQCNALRHVYYDYRESSWNEISIGVYNSAIKEAEKHFGTNFGAGKIDKIQWLLDGEGTLHFEGEGSVGYWNGNPWDVWKADIVKLDISFGITQINNNAFSNCGNLQYLRIPASVKSINNNSFSGCDSIQRVEYSGTKEQWETLVQYVNELKNVTVNYIPLVIFDANGGKAAVTSKAFTKGNTYGELPVPDERLGYSFLGWFTEKEGGDQVTADTRVTEEETHTLYAHWKAEDIRLLFNANAGETDTAVKTVQYGEKIGELPQARREGFTFDGWFTEKEYGRQITEDTVVDFLEDTTLYAHWIIVPVESVILSSESITLEEGVQWAITAKVLPENSTSSNLVWASTDETVAEVVGTGCGALITAKRIGECVISATAKNGVSAKCSVSVCEAGEKIVKIELSSSTLRIKEGETATITARVTPESASDKFLNWTSSDPFVADVSYDGGSALVRAVGKGSATITAMAPGGVSANCMVTVTDSNAGALVESITLSDTKFSMKKGDKKDLIASILPVEAAEADLTWVSNNEKVVTISGTGKKVTLTAMGEGNAKVTVSAKNGVMASCDVTIRGNSPMNPTEPIDEKTTELHLVKGQKFTLSETGWISGDKQALSISKKNVLTAKKVTTSPIKLKKGSRIIDVYITKPSMVSKTITLQAGSSQKISFNYDKEHLKVQWYSNAPDIATVSDEGKVKAVAKGTATITAYVNGSAYTCKVKVNEDIPAVDRTLHMTLNGNKTISVKGVKKVTWVSDDIGIVSVTKKNKITANAIGETVLRTRYEGKEYRIHVFVENPTIRTKGIQSTGKNKYLLNLKSGGSTTIEFASIAQSVIFKSSKGEIAYVDADGVVHANKPGKAKLTTKINGKTVTINVIVSN